MKKLIKFSTLGLLLTIGCSSILTLSSCASINNIHPKIINYSCVAGDNKTTQYDNLQSINNSMESIVYGDKSINHGNYVLFVGTTGGYSDENSDGSKTSLALWGNEQGWNDETSNWSNGCFSMALEYLENIKRPTSDDEIIKDGITFLCYVDFPPADSNDSFSPNETWSAEDEENDKEEKIKEGEYKRNDQSAIEFRMLMDLITQLYGSSYNESIPFAIAYKNGMAKDFTTPTRSDAFLIWICQTYEIDPLTPPTPDE